MTNWHDNKPLFCFNWLIFEAKAEIQKYFRWFLVQLRTFITVFEFDWPLTRQLNKVQTMQLIDIQFNISSRGWVKKKYTNGFKSGGNILGQSASKC